MSSARPVICCTTLRTLSLTREDLLQVPELSRDMNLSEWIPLVEWADHMGTYVIGHMAIFYCPWCGSRLPDTHEETLTAAKQSGIWFDISPDGLTSAMVDGQAVDDADALVAQFRDANNGDDD